MTGVLSDAEMLEARRGSTIIIDPFNAKNMGTSSYDVRIGEWFYREQRPELPNSIFNILDPEHVERVWGEPQCAPYACDALPWDDKRMVNYLGIDASSQVIVLEPQETILAHTEEFIGAVRGATTMMKARSSLGRSFILICKCAGWGDVGYTNRWTMEITNVSRYYSIPLVVGMRVAQLIFFPTGKTIADADYTITGNYQTTNDIAKVMRDWTPAMMLPKTRK